MPKAGPPDLSMFDQENHSPNRSVCSMAIVLDELDPERRASLTAALATPRYTHSAIARVVTGWGYKTSGQTIARHRSGACRCG